MKSSFAYALAGATGAFLLATAIPFSTTSDAATVTADDPVPGLVEEVVAQQVKLVANQTAMDEKIAAIGEEVRQARLFVARGGGKK